VRRGDERAYDALVQRHGEVAFRTAYFITHDASDAEDVVQDAFLKAFLALPRFRSGSPFRPWLLTIVANEARNRVAATRRRASLQLLVGASMSSHDPLLSPETVAVGAERRETLLAAVHLLSDRDRLVIACRYFLELSEEESAAVLGCRQGTVKSRLSRALGRLRGLLSTADVDVREGLVVHE
jgi:RNA polymerase sigma factor (sigma-70 family)